MFEGPQIPFRLRNPNHVVPVRFIGEKFSVLAYKSHGEEFVEEVRDLFRTHTKASDFYIEAMTDFFIKTICKEFRPGATKEYDLMRRVATKTLGLFLGESIKTQKYYGGEWLNISRITKTTAMKSSGVREFTGSDCPACGSPTLYSSGGGVNCVDQDYCGYWNCMGGYPGRYYANAEMV